MTCFVSHITLNRTIHMISHHNILLVAEDQFYKVSPQGLDCCNIKANLFSSSHKGVSLSCAIEWLCYTASCLNLLSVDFLGNRVACRHIKNLSLREQPIHIFELEAFRLWKEEVDDRYPTR